METDTTPRPRRRRTLLAGLLAAAGLALAVPVSGALAGGGESSGTAATEPGAGPGFVQDRERGEPGEPGERDDRGGDRGDCPEHERGGGEREGSSDESFDESREL